MTATERWHYERIPTQPNRSLCTACGAAGVAWWVTQGRRWMAALCPPCTDAHRRVHQPLQLALWEDTP